MMDRGARGLSVSRYWSRTGLHCPHGLMFHHFHGVDHQEGQGSIGADLLADLVELVGGKGTILDADEWFSRAINGRLRESDLCLTFDDGLRCQLDIALPVLDQYGIKAFFFVYTAPLTGVTSRLELYREFRLSAFQDAEDFYAAFVEEIRTSQFAQACQAALIDFSPERYLQEYPFYSEADRKLRYLRDEVLGQRAYGTIMDRMVERYGWMQKGKKSLWMSAEDLQRLHAGGHVVGVHSHTHPTNLVKLNYEEQEIEYRTSYHLLKTLVGVEARAMSHPCNSYDAATLRILRDVGFKVGFRGDGRGRAGSMLEFPREDHSNLVRLMKS